MKQFEFDPEHTFFTSDTHFGHANIINLCKRPFRDVNHMNDMLVENWNSVITDDDIVFHLGDFALGDSEMWNCDGEAYSATSELFNGVETPNITWYDTPIEFEMKYEIAEKS